MVSYYNYKTGFVLIFLKWKLLIRIDLVLSCFRPFIWWGEGSYKTIVVGNYFYIVFIYTRVMLFLKHFNSNTDVLEQ